MFSGLHLMGHAAAQTDGLAEAANNVTDVVFTALERNVLIGVIALSILGMVAFMALWLRDRKSFDAERREMREELTSLTSRATTAVTLAAADANDGRAQDREALEEGFDKVRGEFDKVRAELASLYRETVEELKELRKDDQQRSDKREDKLRAFALQMATTLQEMRDHFQGLGADNDANRRNPS